MNNITTIKHMLTNESLLSVFGCTNFEQEILTVVNTALAHDRMPDFSAYNDPKLGKCECRSDKCSWNEEKIIARLKEKGVWEKIEALYANATNHNLKAVINSNRSFSVTAYPDAEFPYVGEYDNYREMDAAAGFLFGCYPKGYVCHVAHNKPKEYVLMLPEGSKYIAVD